MKSRVYLISALFLYMAALPAIAQIELPGDQPNVRVIKGDASLMLHWFDGNPVYLFGTGASYEQTMTDRWSMDFQINYLVRIDDRINPPQRYTDVIYFALDFRHYLQTAPEGLYWGPGVSLALPTSQTTSGDFFLTGGFHFIEGHLSADINLTFGYGASRDRTDDFWGSYYETWWGFFVRPKVSIGFAF